MGVLKPRVHGYLDYAMVVLFVLAPIVFGMSQGPTLLCWAVAAGYVTMTLLTAFSMGAVDLASYRTHGRIELFLSLALLASPWVFRYSGEPAARNFVLCAGAVLLFTWALTDYHQVTYLDDTGHEHKPRYAQHVS